jgi:hypothetical protein
VFAYEAGTGKDSKVFRLHPQPDGTCDYREFRPHPCGTLIADLVDELATVPTIALDLDWESLCRTIEEHFQVQGVCVKFNGRTGASQGSDGRAEKYSA